jgi:hypothetical protein
LKHQFICFQAQLLSSRWTSVMWVLYQWEINFHKKKEKNIILWKIEKYEKLVNIMMKWISELSINDQKIIWINQKWKIVKIINFGIKRFPSLNI